MSNSYGSHGQVPSKTLVSGEPAAGLQITSHIRLERKLGVGGMGVVWLAFDTRRRFKVAIKFLSNELKESGSQKERFLRVYGIVSDFQHNHICPMYESGEHPELGPWFAMKHINGINLAQYRHLCLKERGVVPIGELLEILKQAALALDYCHRPELIHPGRGPGVIHRDIKPANILIAVDAKQNTLCVQIVDFGLAAVISESTDGVVPKGVYGTQDYMAPEQKAGIFQDHRTDQYSLAVVAYELLGNHKPFADAPGREPHTQPIHLNGLPQVHSVFCKALADNATDRFDSCFEFVDNLRKCLEGVRAVQMNTKTAVMGVESGWIRPEVPLSEAIRVTAASTDDNTATKKKNLHEAHEECLELKSRLEAEAKEADELLETLCGPVNVGIVGTRNAGKSTLFASWYLFRGDRRFNLDLIAEGETLDYLKRVSDDFRSRGSTPATPIVDPERLSFRITVEGRKWAVQTIDFSGELLNPRLRQDKALAATTHQFLQSCDLVIFLHDIQDATIDIVDAIDTVFQGPIQDVVLLLTKFDKLGFQGNSGVSFRAWFLKQLNSHPVLSALYNKIRTSYSQNRVTVVTTSATGGELREPNEEPLAVEELAPFQIFVPLMLGFRRRAERIAAAEKRKEAVAQRLQTLLPRLARIESLVNERSEKQKSAVAEADARLEKSEQRYEQLRQRSPLPVAPMKELLERCRDIQKTFLAAKQSESAEKAARLRRLISQLLMNAVPMELRNTLDRLEHEVDQPEILQFVHQVDRLKDDIQAVRLRCEAAGLFDLASRCDRLSGKISIRLLKIGGLGFGILFGGMIAIILIAKLFGMIS